MPKDKWQKAADRLRHGPVGRRDDLDRNPRIGVHYPKTQEPVARGPCRKPLAHAATAEEHDIGCLRCGRVNTVPVGAEHKLPCSRCHYVLRPSDD